MIKKILLFVLVTTFLPFEMEAEWITINNKKSMPAPPDITIISDDVNGTVLKIDLTGFDAKSFISGDKSYKTVDLLSEIFSTDPGFPSLPYIATTLAIPDQGGLSVEVLETGLVQTFTNVYLPPARASWFEGKPETPYLENKGAYESHEIFPAEYASLETPSVFRDFRIARLSVYPVRYVAATKELQVTTSITVRVNYGKGVVVNPKTTPKHAIAPSFAKLYRSFIANYQNVLDKEYNGVEDGREVMLCIMPDDLTESFQIYADWKRQSGIDIHITKFSDINANANNPDIIKNHISDAYHNWEFPPTYVLLVGDDGVFPKEIVEYPDYSFPNEDYFVEIDGNDYFPEMMVGRFTNQGDVRMQIMINKFLLYEKEPYLADTDWFKKGVCCSNNYYPSQVETKRFTTSVMIEDGGFTVDTLMSDGDGWGSDCTVELSDVVNAINDGRSYLNYRGEGWYYGWSASCYEFSTSDVSSLNNGEKFPFVTSIGCGVAMFDGPGGNCFGEEWVEMGSLTNPRGAAAFIGPTSNTHTAYNNRIDRGIYVGMFQEGMDTPGEALLRGKLYMYNVFGNDYYTEYHYKIFCILGDPSIHIWKDVPQAVNVSYPAIMLVGDNTIDFEVTFASNGQAVANAQVCITGEELFFNGFTDETGHVQLSMTAETEQVLMVTTRGGNVIPYQGTLGVVQADALVEPEGEPVLVDMDGNTDGLLNPNENGFITYTLKNWGFQTVNNVQASLSVINTENVEIITTDPVNFGNLVSGGSFTGSPFQFFVLPECPIGQAVTLKLHVFNSNNSWDYYYNTEIVGCNLNFEDFAIHDASSANPNFRMDPGENVVVIVSVANIGVDVAPEVMGVLSCNDPNITITDSIGTFGTAEVNGILMNFDDYFKVSVDAACPNGYLANYSLKLYTQNGNYPYQTNPTFTMPVGLLVPTDYTGPDDYGYYAYASDDSFFDQTPVFNWVELENIGTKINLSNNGDYTKNVLIPFNFKYYGIDYNQLRISTDGWLAFGNGTQIAPNNTILPNFDNVNNMIAVFWDDLFDIEFFSGDIYYFNDYLNHRFIVEWDNVPHNHFESEPNREVFQAILFDPAYYETITGDGEIIFQYKNVGEPESVTVGIENQSQMIGLQYLFDDVYDPTASALVSEKAIKFTTNPPFASIITSINQNPDSDLANKPNVYHLGQNHPNPFNTSTRITYSVPEQSFVTLSIYTIQGELVRTLQHGIQHSGEYAVDWDGSNDSGKRLVSGMYFYRLQADGFSSTMKMFISK
ncbi:MAG: T9SS type A sorting domain-containing protein [Bacteroidales bacterium]|nr:T9SS type A sorting domain-containing protein [Bacteroidales bacterium]